MLWPPDPAPAPSLPLSLSLFSDPAPSLSLSLSYVEPVRQLSSCQLLLLPQPQTLLDAGIADQASSPGPLDIQVAPCADEAVRPAWTTRVHIRQFQDWPWDTQRGHTLNCPAHIRLRAAHCKTHVLPALGSTAQSATAGVRQPHATDGGE